MSPQRTFYEILGVKPTAAPDEIRRRYRQLAKRYHPDTAPPGDAAAAHRAFVEITEAYTVLSDPHRRESYDRELARQRPQPQRPAPEPGPPPGGQRATAGPPHSSVPPGKTGTRAPGVDRLLHLARLDLARGRLARAQAACEETLRRDPECAAAHSLLGEICRTQGRIEESIRHFMKAVQYSGASAGQPPLGQDRVWRLTAMEGHGPLPRSLRPAVVSGWLIVAGLLVLPAIHPGTRLGVWPVTEWTDNLLLGMGGASLIAGFLIGMAGLVGRADDTWWGLARARGQRRPAWSLLLPLGLFWFPLVLAVCGIQAGRGNKAPGGLVRLLAISTVTVLLFSMAVPAQGQTLLLGGNVVFPCLLLGSCGGVLCRDAR